MSGFIVFSLLEIQGVALDHCSSILWASLSPLFGACETAQEDSEKFGLESHQHAVDAPLCVCVVRMMTHSLSFPNV